MNKITSCCTTIYATLPTITPLSILVALPIFIGFIHPSINSVTVLLYSVISLPYWFSLIKKHLILYSSYILLTVKCSTIGLYLYHLGSGVFNPTIALAIVGILGPEFKFKGVEIRSLSFLSWMVIQEFSYVKSVKRLNRNCNSSC